MKVMNVFIKCGGNDYEHYKSSLKMDASWKLYIFDPLLEDDTYQDDTMKVECTKSAVWISDGSVSFCHDQVAPDSSSLYCLHSIHSTCHTKNVSCIDFSQFLARNKEATIYCVMDVEGAEYTILRHLIANGTIKYIHHLWIRWHYHKNEDSENMMEQLENWIHVETF